METCRVAKLVVDIFRGGHCLRRSLLLASRLFLPLSLRLTLNLRLTLSLLPLPRCTHMRIVFFT